MGFALAPAPCSAAIGSEPITRSILVGPAGLSLMAVLVRTTPPPKPRASAPTTVPTPAKYVVIEKGMVTSSVRKRTRESRERFRAHTRLQSLCVVQCRQWLGARRNCDVLPKGHLRPPGRWNFQIRESERPHRAAAH